jgi:hypothetical protein
MRKPLTDSGERSFHLRHSSAIKLFNDHFLQLLLTDNPRALSYE